MLLEQLKNETLLFFSLHSFLIGLVTGIVIMRARLKQKRKIIEELRLLKENEREFRAIRGGADAAWFLMIDNSIPAKTIISQFTHSVFERYNQMQP